VHERTIPVGGGAAGPGEMNRDMDVEFERTFALLAGRPRLHLACGPNVLEGWANIELTGDGPVIGWDLRRPLPVESGTVEFIFNEHFLEHLELAQGRTLLLDCWRVLRPGGVLRISTPELRKLVDEYLAGRLTEWTDVDWVPETPCRMMNEGMRMWDHQFLYDAPELQRLLRECRFLEVRREEWHQSRHPELRGLECRPYHGEIIFEAVK
jgi:predicted SAM-dependent methyltransferase